MPVYESQCNICGKTYDYFQPVSKYLETPDCCGERTKKVILTAAFGVPDIPEYQSPISGKWIRGKKQRAYDLESNGCRPYEGREAEEKEAARIRKYQDAKDDAFYEKIAIEAVQQLSPENREVLMSAGE